MITTVILLAFNAFLAFLVVLLPSGTLPTAISAAFAYFIGLANAWSYVIPIGTLLQAAGVVLVFDSAMLLWHFINWVIRKIPGMQ